MKKLNSYLLIALALTACTSNLHALTKTRALAQAATAVAHTAANYARQNKLKAAGMVIGGAIALDALQVGARWAFNNYKYGKTIKDIEAARALRPAQGNPQPNLADPLEAGAAIAAQGSAAYTERQYRALLFHPRKASFLLRAYDQIAQSRVVRKIRGR